MSLDIIVLKHADPGVETLEDIEDTDFMGDAFSVETVLNRCFPDCTRHGCVVGERYSLEAVIVGSPVGSIHLTLHFGLEWETSGQAAFLSSLRDLCQALQSMAFAVSDNSRIEFSSPV